MKMSSELILNEKGQGVVTHALLVEKGTDNFALEINPYYTRFYGEKTLSHIGGKLKKGENCLEAIVREVEEETGLIIDSTNFAQHRKIIEEIENVIYCSQTYISIVSSSDFQKMLTKENILAFNAKTIYDWQGKFITEKNGFVKNIVEFLEEAQKHQK